MDAARIPQICRKNTGSDPTAFRLTAIRVKNTEKDLLIGIKRAVQNSIRPHAKISAAEHFDLIFFQLQFISVWIQDQVVVSDSFVFLHCKHTVFPASTPFYIICRNKKTGTANAVPATYCIMLSPFRTG